jgi:uncharacterized protein
MFQSNALQMRWHRTISDVDRIQWDRLAEPLETPLLEWRWLFEMEASGSISPSAGWTPCHLTVWKGQRMVGAAPMYIKAHSDGEFVFDQWWARWAKEAGIRYYPKLVGMSPATPGVGYRFLLDPAVHVQDIQNAMFTAIDDICLQKGISGSHFLFVDPAWMESLDGVRYVPWHHQSFTWRNENYSVFEDYLRPFKSTQRRNIRRERAQMRKMQITIRAFCDEQIDPEMAGLMYDYYLNTNAQFGPWAALYFNEGFFRGLFRQYRRRLLLFAAYHPSQTQPLALSLLLRKGDQLIGRYWGSAGFVKDLHFNMCFYAPIEWAIANGVRMFDPGAGSPHKLYRGFQAVPNTSLHRFYDPRLRLLFGRFIGGINQIEEANIEALNEKLPYASI